MTCTFEGNMDVKAASKIPAEFEFYREKYRD